MQHASLLLGSQGSLAHCPSPIMFLGPWHPLPSLSPAWLARREPRGLCGEEGPLTLLGHLPLLTNPQHLEGFLLGAQRDALDVHLQGHSAQLRAIVKVVHRQLPQAAHKGPGRADRGPGESGCCPGTRGWHPRWLISRPPQHSGNQTRASTVQAPMAPTY